MKRSLGCVIPIAAGLLAIFLLLDAGTYALMPADPASGRRYGCYTALELLIGVKEPSVIRSIQPFLSGGLLFAGFVTWRKLRPRPRRKEEPNSMLR
jgi:hypothetical protein